MALLTLFSLAVLCGCSFVRPGERGRAVSPQDVATEFVRKVIANDIEGGFGLLAISSSLVNYDLPQTVRYLSLGPEDQRRYRKDFIEGVYVFLFRNLPPEQARFTVASTDPGAFVVEVTGRPRKTLRLTLTNTGEGLRISRIDKVE
jgi:hypothetical protein